MLIIDRGLCTFASKALRAEAAGAAVAVIIQTHDVWPYMMEDSKGEAKAAGGLGIPVCIVSKEKGLRGLLSARPELVQFSRISPRYFAGIRRDVLLGKTMRRHGEAQSSCDYIILYREDKNACISSHERNAAVHSGPVDRCDRLCC